MTTSLNAQLSFYDNGAQNNDNETQTEENETLDLLESLSAIDPAPEADSVTLIQALENKKNNPYQLGKNPNLPADILHAPLQGPLLPQQKQSTLEFFHAKNTVSGHVEKCHVNDFAFDIQLRDFQRYGHAVNPTEVGSFNSKKPQVLEARAPRQSLANTNYYRNRAEAQKLGENLSRRHLKKLRRLESGDPSSDDYKGPWAGFTFEEKRREELEREGALKAQEYAELHKEEATEQPKESTTEESVATSIVKPTKKKTTLLHIKDDVNFEGLSWIKRPLKFVERDSSERNYLPKTLVHTFTGHKMGVQALRFFPRSGHLLLSASLDGQCKIWGINTEHHKHCIRTYLGHSMAIRDVQFAEDGLKFYTCSLDKTICQWDTEYGKSIGTFTNDKTPYCVSVHPDKSMQNVFIVGSSNKHAVQFDANTGEITQEYCEHLATVNTVTFCENGQKIVTTADDKKMFIWEFGIPVVVKHIAEPFMRSMPAVRLHPSGKFIACQSMDNQILVYEAMGRFRFQGPRRFRGHGNSGYAILPGISPDGRFIASGDNSGRAFFWDWKTLKNMRTLQAHDRVCMGTEWHPTHASMVATCGWDGMIRLWE